MALEHSFRSLPDLNSRHDTAIRTLMQSVEATAAVFDSLHPFGNGSASASGAWLASSCFLAAAKTTCNASQLREQSL